MFSRVEDHIYNYTGRIRRKPESVISNLQWYRLRLACTFSQSYHYQSSFVVRSGKYSKTCVKQPLWKRPKIGFREQSSLNAGQKYCRMLILQYFWPSLSYHLSLISMFCLFLSGGFTQVLLYNIDTCYMLNLKTEQAGLSHTWWL